MDDREELKHRLSDYIENLIKNAYMQGFSDGWSKSTEFHDIGDAQQINSNEYVLIMSECLRKFDDSYELPS